MKAAELRVGEEYAVQRGQYGTRRRVRILDTRPHAEVYQSASRTYEPRLVSSFGGARRGVLGIALNQQTGAIATGGWTGDDGVEVSPSVIGLASIKRTWAEQVERDEANARTRREREEQMAREEAERRAAIVPVREQLNSVGLDFTNRLDTYVRTGNKAIHVTFDELAQLAEFLMPGERYHVDGVGVLVIEDDA